MKVNGTDLWMVVHPETGSVVYAVGESERAVYKTAGRVLGMPAYGRKDVEAMGYKAVRVTELRYAGEVE